MLCSLAMQIYLNFSILLSFNVLKHNHGCGNIHCDDIIRMCIVLNIVNELLFNCYEKKVEGKFIEQMVNITRF